MKSNSTIIVLATSLLLVSTGTFAGALKPDCSAKKAGKNIAMKATMGVGGRCSPTDAARDSDETSGTHLDFTNLVYASIVK